MRNRIAATIGATFLTAAAVTGVTVAASSHAAASYSHVHAAAAAPAPAPSPTVSTDMYHHN